MQYYPNISAYTCVSAVHFLGISTWPGGFGTQCTPLGTSKVELWPQPISDELWQLSSAVPELQVKIYNFQNPLPNTHHAVDMLAFMIKRHIIAVPTTCQISNLRRQAWTDSSYTTAAGILKHSPSNVVSLSFFDTYMPLHAVSALLLIIYVLKKRNDNKTIQKIKYR